MKKFLKICLYTIALAVAVFMVGCKGNDLPVDNGKLKIVTTIFPEYEMCIRDSRKVPCNICLINL